MRGRPTRRVAATVIIASVATSVAFTAVPGAAETGSAEPPSLISVAPPAPESATTNWGATLLAGERAADPDDHGVEPLPGGDPQVLEVRLRADTSIDDVAALQGRAAGVRVDPLFTRPAAELRAEQAEAERVSGVRQPDLTRWIVVRSPSAAIGERLAAELRADPAVTFVQAALPLSSGDDAGEERTGPTPRDPDDDLQGYLDPAPSGIDARWAWGQPAGRGDQVTVGVVDSGFDTNNDDLDRANSGVNLRPYAPSDERHGTHVLGILVADDDGQGIVGIASGARIRTVTSGSNTADGANAMNQLTSGMAGGDVVNVSQGVCPESDCLPVIPLVYSESSRAALTLAASRGIIVVVSGGNCTPSCGADLDLYADRLGNGAPGALVVGAGNSPEVAGCTSEDGASRSRIESSNYDGRIDLQGWGTCVYTTAPDDEYLYWGFTSAATPVVAGAAALLSSIAERTRGLNLSGDQVRRLLRTSGSPQVFGRGGNIGPLPNLRAAVLALGNIPLNDMFWQASTITTIPTSVGLDATWAGVEVGEPPPTCVNSIGRTTWYKYTPTTNQRLAVDTKGSDFDTFVMAWQFGGTSLAAVGCSDAGISAEVQARLDVDLVAGRTYYFQVGGVGVAAGRLALKFEPGANSRGACDLNGDGRDELVAGAPGEQIGRPARTAGAVFVQYGSATVPTGGALRSNESRKVQGKPQDGDEFGAAVACGDLDGDGYDELIVGEPGEKIDGLAGAGAVYIFAGTSSGVSTAARRLDQSTDGVPSGVAAGERFGAALATGDVTGDGIDDLVIGAPGESIDGKAEAGAVYVAVGSEKGLRRQVRRYTGASRGISGDAGAGDTFGAALAVGQVNKDRYADIVIGVPGASVQGNAGAGAAVVVFGSVKARLKDTAILTQRRVGPDQVPEAGDRFGAAVAVIDQDDDRRADVAVGVPGEDVVVGGANRADVGVVHVFEATRKPGPFLPRNVITLDQSMVAEADDADAGDEFGATLGVGNVDRVSGEDLVISAPGESDRGAQRSGIVHVFRGPSLARATFTIQQDRSGVPGLHEAGDRFGSSLGVIDLNGDGAADVAVGSTAESVGDVARAGAIVLVFGARKALATAGNLVVTEEAPVNLSAAEEGEAYSAAIGG